jgi:Holliday junction resolvase RusA-like endonuclease
VHRTVKQNEGPAAHGLALFLARKALGSWTWVLPYPIGANTNHGYLPGGRGRRVFSPAARAYRRDAETVVRAAGWRPPAGPLELTLDLFPPDARKRDADGMKLVQDAIFDALGEDDARVVRLVVTKHPPDKTAPRVVARLGLVGTEVGG